MFIQKGNLRRAALRALQIRMGGGKGFGSLPAIAAFTLGRKMPKGEPWIWDLQF